ncbi:M23 family metallopeptidase [Micromonospora sp. DT31]|uniref:M23 family metallopeptidase n=1 Tax=Micromonospora sp. DT31 TaxID=3393434 RepID=UPI003CF2480D
MVQGTNHRSTNTVDFNRTDDAGDPVVASAPGTVDVVKKLGDTSYGRYARINHGGGYTTYYAHLSGFNASVGQSVQHGQVIGYVGTTGNSSGTRGLPGPGLPAVERHLNAGAASAGVLGTTGPSSVSASKRIKRSFM